MSVCQKTAVTWVTQPCTGYLYRLGQYKGELAGVPVKCVCVWLRLRLVFWAWPSQPHSPQPLGTSAEFIISLSFSFFADGADASW